MQSIKLKFAENNPIAPCSGESLKFKCSAPCPVLPSAVNAKNPWAAMKLNAVSVTPLEPMMFNSTETYIDRITNIVRIRH